MLRFSEVLFKCRECDGYIKTCSRFKRLGFIPDDYGAMLGGNRRGGGEIRGNRKFLAFGIRHFQRDDCT